MHRKIVLCWLLGMVCFPAHAQEEEDGGESLDRIEVVGSRISYRDLLETPAVSLTKPGDYLLQSITLTNDSRDPALRKRELHDTIAQMIGAAGSRYRIYHEDEYRVQLARGNHQVEPENGKRPDSSQIALRIGVDIGANAAQAETIIGEMRRFLRGAAKVGRTEVELGGETALVMNRPERFRYEIIDAIAKDSQKLIDAMALDCKIELQGLNSRVEWQRASAAELLLYIPYNMTISDCRRRMP
jgi:hypothetical protein